MEQMAKPVPLSILDLVPVRQGFTTADAFRDMIGLARHAEERGFERFWLSEHHNTMTLASSATSILISKVLEKTDSIRVGSGGIMLPNHTPLVVAEQFGTLATMHPDRLDLGLGRAPGTDMQTAHALRRTTEETAFAFPQDVLELQRYLQPEENQGPVRAYPGVGTEVPIYILGSSISSAQLAARLGLPYVFAAHFAPQQLEQAVSLYRRLFEPSDYLDKPFVMVCVNAIVAETDEQAEFIGTSSDLFYRNVVKGTKEPLLSPVETMEGQWNYYEENMVRAMTEYTFKGSKARVTAELRDFIEWLQPDELMAASYIYDQEERHRSYTLLQEAMRAV